MSRKNNKSQAESPRFTVIRGGQVEASPLLLNLLQDTSPPILAYIAEQYGLLRVPGLSHSALIDRILRQLSPAGLEKLEKSLIAARYGSLSVDELLELAIQTRPTGRKQPPRPRLDDMPHEAVTLVESAPRRWVYTMHGHDVVVDLNRRHLSCDCEYFKYSSHRQALCKHLARALTSLPAIYARETLIDMLVSKEYGGPDTPRWHFDHPKAA